MRYCGNKQRFAKELIPIITEHLNDDRTLFVDAFCGGANIICNVDHPNKLAIDNDRYIIDLWEHIKLHGIDGMPSSLTREMYNDIHNSEINCDGRYPDWYIGYVSTSCSYGSKVWGGYAAYNKKRDEDHIKEAYNNLKKQIENFKYLKETQFICCSYHDMPFQPGTVIYCDPPYSDTVQYRTTFNHEKFWDWVRTLTRNGCYVYVSEYSAPSDFKCIWQKKKKDGMGTTKSGVKQNSKIEKLFVYNGK